MSFKLIRLKDLTYNTTNLTDDVTPQWSNTAGYSLDTQRQLNNKLYKALDLIDPLCTYIYDNTDPLNPHYTVTAVDDAEVADNTSVSCTSGATVVYVVDNSTFYIAQTTGNLDFTNEDIEAPQNFTTATGYRYLKYNPEDTPLKWEDLGYTNKYKCLDQSLNSQTVLDSNIEMSFIVTKVDEIHLFNVVGESVDVVVTRTSDSVEIYNENLPLIDKNGGTFYNWVFNDFVYTTGVHEQVSIAFEVEVDITINAVNNEAKIGLVAIGKGDELGGTLYGSSAGIMDFSKKITNETTGEIYLEKGNYKATNNLTVDIEAGRDDYVKDLLTEYRSTPVVFTSSGKKSLTIFGVYNNFDVVFSTPTLSRLTIDLESLI